MKIGIQNLIIFVSIISLIQALLVINGLLEPISSYSYGNLFFSLLRFVAVIYSGAIAINWKDAVKKGALVSFFGSFVLIFCAFLSSIFLKIPLIGILVSGLEIITLTLLLILIQNIIIGIIFSLAGYFINCKLIQTNNKTKKIKNL